MPITAAYQAAACGAYLAPSKTFSLEQLAG
jgi:hypothetical protein